MTGSELSLGVDPDMVIKDLQPEEYAARLLFLIRELTERDPAYRPWHDGFQNISRGYLVGINDPRYAQKLKDVDLAFSEAWAWLEVQGLLVPDRDMSGLGYRRLSRRAQQFVDLVDVSRYAAARLLPRDSLHPAIAQTVWSAFIRGEFDVAVFQAMKAVEIAVRKASHENGSSTGLMRNAFAVAGEEKNGDQKVDGPLSDPQLDSGERRGVRNLFMGAMAMFRNPQAHTHVNLDDPVEAVEIVMLANHLLRIVDARQAARLAKVSCPEGSEG